MTYGQTSSGKTYTLFGQNKNEGIVVKFLREAFERLNELESFEDIQYTFKYSFFEIYNEKIFDMLSPDQSIHLALRETKKNKIFVEGLTKKKALEFKEVLEDLYLALENRHTNETKMNERSSRSHFILNFQIETKCLIDYEDIQSHDQSQVQKNYYEVKKKAKIIFIDLAGSEKQNENTLKVMEEGCYINKSLSVLNHVIKNLSKKGKQDYSHFRDSKLTFYLKEIFRGNSHFSVLGNILPYQEFMNDTLNTLNFVSLAQTIETNPKINFITKNNTFMMQKQIKTLLQKIEYLEKQ